MSRLNSVAAFLLTGALAVAVGSEAAAQNEKKEYLGKGSIGELGPEGIQFNDAEGKTVLVGINRGKTKVTVTGAAEPGFLSPGRVVRFSAAMTNKGFVEEKIKELSVIETSDVVRVGAQPDLSPGEDLKEAEKKGPVTWIVIGPIRTFKNNQLQVNAGGKAIKAELADDCKITIDVSDFTIAREGDEISVEGTVFQEGQRVGDITTPTQVLGAKVEITLSKPLTAPSKKKGGAKAKTPKKKRGKKGEEPLFGN